MDPPVAQASTKSPGERSKAAVTGWGWLLTHRADPRPCASRVNPADRSSRVGSDECGECGESLDQALIAGAGALTERIAEGELKCTDPELFTRIAHDRAIGDTGTEAGLSECDLEPCLTEDPDRGVNECVRLRPTGAHEHLWVLTISGTAVEIDDQAEAALTQRLARAEQAP